MLNLIYVEIETNEVLDPPSFIHGDKYPQSIMKYRILNNKI